MMNSMVSNNSLIHPSDDALELYSLNRLPEDDVATVEEHLLVCAECRIRLEEFDEYVAAMRAALVEERQRAAGRHTESVWAARWRWPKPLWAGAVLAAGIVAVTMTWQPASHHPPYTVNLESWRGAELVPAVPADRSLVLRIDAAGLPEFPSYVLEIVDTRGTPVFQANAVPSGNFVTADLGRSLPAGQYWVRLYAPPGAMGSAHTLLREAGLKTE